MTNPEYLEHAKIMRVQPGDVIWVAMNKRLTRQEAETLHDQLKTSFPHNKVLIGTEGIDIHLVRMDQS